MPLDMKKLENIASCQSIINRVTNIDNEITKELAILRELPSTASVEIM